MKRAVTAVLPVLLLAGCMGTAPKAPVNWTIEPKAASVFSAAAAKWGTVRLASVSVRAPYDGQRLAVLRADGSIAFDAFNTFAAAPAALTSCAPLLPAVSPAASAAKCGSILRPTFFGRVKWL